MGRRGKGPSKAPSSPRQPDDSARGAHRRRVELPPAKVEGAICLPAPGHWCGPCLDPCGHRRCGIAREVAAQRCSICGVPNGYQVPIYAYATRCGHADCIDESHRLAMEGAIDALIDLTLKHAVQRMKDGAASPDVAADEAKVAPPPPSKEVSAWTRYMRPEFEFEVMIPAIVSCRSNRVR